LNAKITIAGTLKPVSEPRSFKKIAASLAQHDYQIDIIGAYPTEKTTPKTVLLHPHKYARRGFKRFLLPWKIFSKIRKIKPDILIVNTHELLLIGALYRVVFRNKLIYDIRENYNYNLRFQNIYARPVGWLLGSYVRIKEILLSPIVDYFFLAEECYREEISFIKTRNHLVLENKFIPEQPAIRKVHDQSVELLMSGTISILYGALEAVKFIAYLPSEKYSMHIIGHCPDPALRATLESKAKDLKNLRVTLSPDPIPHEEILEAINLNTVGILPYRPNKSTKNKVPTKLYEYIGMGVPVLISPNSIWQMIIEQYKAGSIVDFNLPPDKELISNSINLTKEPNNIDLQNIMWKSCESSLFSALKEVLAN
jgi:glycogen(starch) synthase